jgi:PAT family beta-lactamase induction signal transducer AmpG
MFVIFYKIGDALLGKMVNPFYQQMGFTKSEVAIIIKFYGFAMTIIGGLIGGWAVYRIGIKKCLIYFGIFQAISNLLFIWQAHAGHDTDILKFVITVENTASAMGTAAFTAYLSSLCNVKFTATQYALLTSFMSLGRWFTNVPSGYLVDKTYGLGLPWESYFIITVVLAIPGLLLIKYLKINDNYIKRHSA